MKYFVLSLFIIPSFIFSQSINDTIEKYSIDELKSKYYENQSIKELARFYGKSYLEKTKKNKDVMLILKGYELMAMSSELEESLKYSDTIIELSKTIDDPMYPLKGYYLKSYTFSENQKYNDALLFTIKYLNEAEENNLPEDFIVIAKYDIAVIEYEKRGNVDEAIKILKDIIKHYESKDDISKVYDGYSLSILALSEIYRKEHKIDSSSYLLKKGIKIPLKYNDKTISSYFTLFEGVNYFYREKLNIAKDSIVKALPLIKKDDVANIILGYYYLAVLNDKFGLYEDADMYFKKIDSIYLKKPIFVRELRYSYQYRYDNAKKSNNIRKQLEYINDILQLDSIYHEDYKNITRTLNVDYKQEQLKQDKIQIQNELNTNKSSNNIVKLVMLVLILSMLVLSIFYVKRTNHFKRKFNELIEDKKEIPKIKTEKIISVPDNTVKTVLNNLEKFEKSEKYLRPGLSSYDLSKYLNVNKKYLSIIINSKT